MKKQLSDEQIDTFVRALVNEAAADKALLSEIAESPATWWGVQRKINEQKAETLSPWPPLGKTLRWLLAGGLATTAAVLILTLLVFRPVPIDQNGAVAVVSPAVPLTQTAPETMTRTEVPQGTDNKGSEIGVSKRMSVTKPWPKAGVHQIAAKPRTVEQKSSPKTQIAKATKKEEIKTEFIALSYARDPESGHIVRVKVPSSMMVSLGLVTVVQAPSEMVDAEVLVGDDGLTRAIRFIR